MAFRSISPTRPTPPLAPASTSPSRWTCRKRVTSSTVVWSTQEAFVLNPSAPLTLTPLGNGADMALFIPVASFNGLNLTGSDTFIVRATHSNSHNGNEEWLFTDRGITTPVVFFDPIDPIFDPGVNGIPEPSTFDLGLLGAGLLALRRRA